MEEAMSRYWTRAAVGAISAAHWERRTALQGLRLCKAFGRRTIRTLEREAMAECIIEGIAAPKRRVRERLDQFRRLLDTVFEPRMLEVITPPTRSRMINSMSGAEIGPHLREVALRCQTLARDSRDERAARALEEIGGELADRAGSLEAVFAVPNATRSP